MAQHPADAEIRALSRRRFLKTALFVSAAGAVAMGGTLALLSRSPTDGQRKPAGIVAMSDSEYALFAAVCVASLPGEDNAHGLVPWTHVPVLQNIDHLVAGIPPHARGDVTAAFALFDHAPIVSGWHGKRFVDLDVASAREFLDAWNHGGEIQRAVSNLVRKLAYIAYWREAVTWPAIQYDGPVMARWGLVRYGNAPMPVAPLPAQPAAQTGGG